VGVDFLNASGVEISEINLQITATSYTLRSATQTVPAGATQARIWTWKSGTTGNLFLDDFCLTGPSATDTQPPSIPSGLSASALTQSSFTLSWTASTDNLGVTGYEVFRNGTSIGTPSTTSLSVTGLSAGTTHAMTVRARDAAGNRSAQSAALNVTTSDTQAPSAPSGLSSSSVTQTSFTLSWIGSTDNVGVTGYQVFRNGTSVGTPSGTSISLTGLSASTTYSMTVRARDAAGNLSALSPALSVTTSGGSTGNFNITINKGVRFQTIDGFGFFGAMNSWWGSPSSLWSDAWGDQVISDLGITIWRNEYFPPADRFGGQDADWNKQRPVVRGLKAKADQYGVNLKFIFTVWSPPSSMKVKVENNTRLIGTPHPFGTKQGGALDPTKYGAYANYLADGIRLYQNEGINLYALSPQNEPFFVQAFNSCWYKQEWYPEMLINVIPSVKAVFPNVKIFGSEGMLEMEAADNNWPWFYHKQILDSQQARNNIDILAVHGYQDGVAPTSGSILGHLWSSHKTHFGDPMGKRQWMTETSGYQDSWTANPGAFSLASDMMSGLNNGNMSGWVFWQGSENPGSQGIGEFVLMNGAVKGKKYYVSKQFYRYIRPGAVRVGATSTNSNVFVSAYQHTAQGTHTIVLINTAATAQNVTLGGADLPASFTIFRTSATDNAADVGVYITGSVLSLPARSVVTLQAGGTPLATVE
jgi:glucuronoarabinoxylan endo-1,4-beta-xylanase